MQRYIKTDIVSAELKAKSFTQPITVNGIDDYTPVWYDGYIVIDKNDNKNWMPKAVFESSYRLAENMGIGLAVEALKDGYHVSMGAWSGSIHLELVLQEDGRHWIGMRIDDDLEEWLPLSVDMLSEDYYIIDENVENLRDRRFGVNADKGKKNL